MPKYKLSKQIHKFVEKNMFSKGQLFFAGFFIIAFVIGMIYAYRKDKALHALFYKGNYKILLGFIAFVILLFIIKIVFKH
ncbi:hypothetical protein CLV55_11363 [Flavobacterium aciduliphilum]|uniref:Uncharacterized protein n=1 Tax=Flavobacterium aciduliphilum TaxID=1101402 RepID=A0A328YA65_9FLAO|nr:hypothetical protein CLV55_11363 [Flavobacterium aciduliphilum]